MPAFLPVLARLVLGSWDLGVRFWSNPPEPVLCSRRERDAIWDACDSALESGTLFFTMEELNGGQLSYRPKGSQRFGQLSGTVAISPIGPVRPAWIMVTPGKSYTPQASDENTHSAWGRLLPSISPRHLVPDREPT